MTNDELKDVLDTAIRSGLDAELNRGVILAQIEERISRLLQDRDPQDHLDHWDGVSDLASVLAYDFAGIPEGVDPKTMLQSVPTDVLERVLAEWPAGHTTQIIDLELGVRRGKFVDWRFTRISSSWAKLEFMPVLPMQFIYLEFKI